jgi:hypothetical protein
MKPFVTTCAASASAVERERERQRDRPRDVVAGQRRDRVDACSNAVVSTRQVYPNASVRGGSVKFNAVGFLTMTSAFACH